ncbi:MAG: RRXRR domain-containing protein, partial [Chlamydiota bacterium]
MLAYVLNKKGKPLMPCSPCVARRLLESKKAKVVSLEPFTIKLLFGSSGYTQPITVGIDSGSHTAAFAAQAIGK